MIHGIWSDSSGFEDLKTYFSTISQNTDFADQYKVYSFSYDSDKHIVWEIGRSLRNHLDSFKKANSDFDKEIVIIAHSLGGLVTRAFMNQHKVNYGIGKGNETGFRVRLAITLGTPHHGSHLANENLRVPDSYISESPNAIPISFNGRLVFWNSLLGGLGDLLFAKSGCVKCVYDPTLPNRSDLRWDNYDITWDASRYDDKQEKNNWLLNEVPHTFDDRIIAYAGYLKANESIARIGKILNYDDFKKELQTGLPVTIRDKYEPISVILQRLMKNNFEMEISSVLNDGVVPRDSALFVRPPGASWPGLKGRRTCVGFNHEEMHSKNSSSEPCVDQKSGTRLPLFEFIASDLGVKPKSVTQNKAILSIEPNSEIRYPNTLISSSSIQKLIVRNLGTKSVRLARITLSGSQTDQFSINSISTFPIDLAPNAALEVVVNFRPTSIGDKTASISIESNAEYNATKTVNLSGKGVMPECNYTLSADQEPFGNLLSFGNVTIQASSGCSWTASTDSPWLNLISGANGTGTQVLSYSVDGNTSSSLRVGYITVVGSNTSLTLRVIQDGKGSAVTQCNLSLTSYLKQYSADTTSDIFYITTAKTCTWSATTDSPSWITINSGKSGAGSQSVKYTVAANSTSNPRVGTIKVLGQNNKSEILTIKQDGKANTCILILSESERSVPVDGVTASISVSTTAQCGWQANSDASWIKINSGTFGTGAVSIGYVVEKNPTTNTRIGTISVRDQKSAKTVTINQAGQPDKFPDINLANTNYPFGEALLNTNIYQTVVIQNTGSDYLVISSVHKTTEDNSFSAFPFSPYIQPGGSGSVMIQFSPTSIGQKTANFSVSSNDPDEVGVNFTVTGSGVTQKQGGNDFIWSNVSTIPSGINFYRSASAIIGSKIYLLGGGYYSVNTTAGYKWEQIAAPPLGISESGAVAISGKIYVVGQDVDARVQIYDPVTNRWDVGSELPTLRRGLAVATVNSKLYAIGGANNAGTHSVVVEEYNPATNSWQKRADMPTARAYAGVAVVNNIIYVLGGDIPGNQSNKIEAYDPVANTWTSKGNLLFPPRAGASAVSLQGKIYLIGGETYGENALNLVQEYDPSNNLVTAKNAILTARTSAVAAVVNDMVYLIGGTNAQGNAVTSVEEGKQAASPILNSPVRAVSFGDVAVGSIGERFFEIQNLGTSPLTLGFQRLTGTDEYSISTDGQPFVIGVSGLAISPGKSMFVRIRFTPVSTGTRQAVYRITSNDSKNASIEVNLSANGTQSQELATGTWQVIDTIPTGGTGRAREISISNGKAYLTIDKNEFGSAGLRVVDLSNKTVLGNVSFSSYPTSETGNIAIQANRAYVPINTGPNGQLAIVNIANNTLLKYVGVGALPWGAAAIGNQVFVTNLTYPVNNGASSVQILDSSTDTVLKTVNVGRGAIYAAADELLRRAYIVNQCDDCGKFTDNPLRSVSVIDTTTNTVIATIPIRFAPNSLVIVGTSAYVCSDSFVEVIDLASNTIRASVPVPNGSQEIAANSEYVFVPYYDSSGKQGISVIRISDNVLVGSINISNVTALAVDPSTNYLYVIHTNFGNQIISVVRQFRPNFSLTCDAQALVIGKGNSGQTNCTVVSTDGYSQPVSLGCDGLAGCGFAVNKIQSFVSSSANVDPPPNILNISVPSNAVPGTYSLTVTGTSDNQVQSVRMIVTVPSCDFLLSSPGKSFGPEAATDSVSVAATSDCAWTAVSDSSWLKVTAGSPGSGSGTVQFTIEANTSTASRSGKLTIADQIFTVIQAGGAPEITVTPTSIGYGSTVVGATSAAQTVTIKNDGAANLNIGVITLGGTNAGDFLKGTDTCSNKSLPPSQSCTVGASFNPMALGARNATLIIPSNDADEATVNVTLSGTGSDPNAPTSVQVSAPSAGQTIYELFTLKASAADNSGTIQKIEFYVDADVAPTCTDATAKASGSTFQCNWDTATKANGAHTVKARAYDPSGNFADSATVSFNIANGVAIQLSAGWNLISLPVQPTNTAIASALAPISGKYESVWAFDSATKKYQGYFPATPQFSDLTMVEAGRGYWILMKEAATLNVVGATPSRTITLRPGWNLVGYSDLTQRNIAQGLNSIAGKYTRVWAWNAATKRFQGYFPDNPLLSDLSVLQVGKGYFIFVTATEPVNWILP
ncbi:MAG: choice-of-anchor D domain-containing protein [Acidobacteria bacterium]|nr:choice-of-anchor D domain-containing protein [Acidobacteriota bacterium]